jgi:sigma-B regulation protein RsbU (phosphoserine phosphatase)
VIRLGARRAGICIADFAVRWEWGMQYLYAFKNSFRLAARREQSPARVLTEVNREMEAEVASDPASQDRPYAFASMCYVVIDLDQGALCYATAGNEPPFLLSAGKAPRSLEKAGIVLNVTPEAQYEEESVPLQAGDGLILFTDGITEVRNAEGQFLGREGIQACLEGEHAALSASALADVIFNRANDFGHRGQRRDDMTLLVVKVTATDLGTV